MSHKIDPKDVLIYLNELGYTNINAQQLKDFISDLKKLIKYEKKHKQKENIETITPINSNTADFCHCPYIQAHIKHHQNLVSSPRNEDKLYCSHPQCSRKQANASKDKEEQDNIFSHLHSQHTVASKAKEAPKKDKCISVHITRPKHKTDLHQHCTHLEKMSTEQDGGLQLIQNIETVSDGSKLYINTESTLKTTEPSSKQSLTTKPSISKRKSKSSFIRCSSPKSINKSDPVALYHYYQEQWKRQKFPGQENHSDLRWSVREKMLSGPKVVCSTTSCRKRTNSWKG